MKKFIPLIGLLMLTGCTTPPLAPFPATDHQIAHEVSVQGSVWGGRAIAPAGLVEIGYGDLNVNTGEVLAGQGWAIRTRQYSSFWSTNMTYESLYIVFPCTDSKVTVSQQRDALLSVLGVSVPNPVGDVHTTVKVEDRK